MTTSEERANIAPEDVVVCTIIARNYLAAARVLGHSLRAVHPNWRFIVLVIDDVYGVVDDTHEPFDVLRLGDIGISTDEMLRMAAIYTVMELSTAVKPWLLESLLDHGAAVAIYLDPDIKVYSDLSEIAVRAMSHEIVLTPHVTLPLPRDGMWKSEEQVLESGIFNLGFVAVSTRGTSFLTFWQERLSRDCISDPKRMLFVDQRWVDFAPGFYDIDVLRDTGYNAAYWNVHERPIQIENGMATAGEAMLRFFHFSGFDPAKPFLLSKHQGQRPRVLLSDLPALKSLCDDYAEELLTAGHVEATRIEYGYARLGNGLVYDWAMRRAYRDALKDAEAKGSRLPPNPYDSAGAMAFIDWLNEPGTALGHPRLTRYLAQLYELRGDLQDAFPDVDGTEYVNFVEWSYHEVAEKRLAEVFAALEPAPVDTLLGGDGVVDPGVRVAGYLRAETGVGEHGRLALSAISSAGIETSAFVDETSVGRQTHPFASNPTRDLNVNLVCVNADELEHFAERVGPEFFRDHYTIGLWAWEVEEFPRRFVGALDLVDEVWANSSFSMTAISQLTAKPVFAFPLPIRVPEVRPEIVAQMDRMYGSVGFRFLFCFDFLSIGPRKNPLAVVRAFQHAFRDGEGAELVIKAVNGDQKVQELEELRFALAGRSDIRLIDHYLSPDENAALMASSDCYVSLHRSEGFGLTLAEAMALGKPVIATAYSGNMDFMSAETAYLVPFEMTTIPAGCDPYPAGGKWAEPNWLEAASLMRHVFANPDEAREVGKRAQRYVLDNFGMQSRAQFISERFRAAQGVLRERAVSDSDGGTPTVPELIELALKERDMNVPSRHPRLARVYRRLVRRALRHYDDQQRQMNLKIALGVEHLAAIVNRVAQDDHAAEFRVTVSSFTQQIEILQRAIADQGVLLQRQAEQIAALRGVDEAAKPNCGS